MTTDNKGAMTAKSVAVVRVTHKGYGMELSTYVAYALPEGMHHLYAQPAQAVTHALTPKMIEAAYEAHYGKERVRTCGGAAGIDMTVDGVGYNGVEAFTRMWNGALGVIAPVPAEGAKTCCRKRPCEHPGKGPCDMPAAPEPIHASDTVESSWAPNRIWLQREFGDDGSHTWCADSQDEHEQAEYVRVSASAVDAVHAAALSPITLDEQRLAVWKAIKSIKFGSPSDDKVLVDALHKVGYTIVKVSTATKGEAS